MWLLPLQSSALGEIQVNKLVEGTLGTPRFLKMWSVPQDRIMNIKNKNHISFSQDRRLTNIYISQDQYKHSLHLISQIKWYIVQGASAGLTRFNFHLAIHFNSKDFISAALNYSSVFTFASINLCFSYNTFQFKWLWSRLHINDRQTEKILLTLNECIDTLSEV